ncbi:MAG: hypothetical protein Kapaf2KO_22510 [Candidatus Kapaibacteriales bacterium]
MKPVFPLGTLCVIDSKPKRLSKLQIELLKSLSRQVVTQLTLRKRNRELERELEAKQLIYSILSHDLKGPLGSYSNILEIIEEEIHNLQFLGEKNEKTELLKALIGSLKKSNKEIYELLLTILDWTKTYNSTIIATKKSVDIPATLDNIITIYSQSIDTKKISINLDLSVEQIETDQNILSTILRNLISNAIKYSNDGGSIMISVSNSPDSPNHTQLTVEDSGIGMEKAKLEEILNVSEGNINMEGYTKGTSDEIGFSLGMSVINSLLKAINGSMSIDSIVGKGTKIIITF